MFLGNAIRMAQDLGLHREIDFSALRVPESMKYSPDEQQARRRLWFGCLVLDRYVSSFIGRPGVSVPIDVAMSLY